MAKSVKKLLCLMLALLMLVLAGCGGKTDGGSTTEPTDPVDNTPSLEDRLEYYSSLGSSPDDNYRVWYEIFVYSFCDSNNTGIAATALETTTS